MWYLRANFLLSKDILTAGAGLGRCVAQDDDEDIQVEHETTVKIIDKL